MAKDLRTFLDKVRQMQAAGGSFKEAGIVDVKRPMSWDLEVPTLQQKLAKGLRHRKIDPGEARHPAIFCHKIEGSKIPLVTNLLGSWEMHGASLGLEPSQWNEKGLTSEYKKRLAKPVPTVTVDASKAPVKEVILKGDDVDLGLLPILRHATLNSGRYITVGCMVCMDPDTGIPNAGIYRHEVKGKNLLGAMINPKHHGDYIAHRYAQLGKPMEVIIYDGHHPAVVTAACVNGPVELNEYEVAGAYLGEPLEVIKAETVNIPVPARSEIIIEGVIDNPREMVTDGPFSEGGGYYGRGEKPCYLIRVTAITMRKDAIYHDLDPCSREHGTTGGSSRTMDVFNAVKEVVPTVKAVRSTGPVVFVSIEKRAEGEGKWAALAAMTRSYNAAFVIVVDDDVDVFDDKRLWWAIGSRVVPDQNIDMITRVTGHHLSPVAYNEAREPLVEGGPMQTRVIIDATKPLHIPFSTAIEPAWDLYNSMKVEDYIT
ncbi:MAG: UbiD family decarboxylase [Deltaproteobacteria bacterium]|nr:UbiD family decarboxylase [Deltaproteobacteria bacterium]